MKPVLLIDIDGVINPEIAKNKSLHNNKHNNHWTGTWESVNFLRPDDNEELLFIYSTAMLQKIKELEKKFIILWHSTWQEYTQSILLEILDKHALHYPIIKRVDGLDSPIINLGKRWWKVNSLEEFLKLNPRNFYFFDDLITPQIRREVKNLALKYNVQGDCRKTNKTLGLTIDDFEILDKFHSSLSA